MDELDGNDDPKAVQLVLSLSPQDVFILQLDGRKEWKLYDVPTSNPFMGHKVGRVVNFVILLDLFAALSMAPLTLESIVNHDCSPRASLRPRRGGRG